jgi:hypothetical protein
MADVTAYKRCITNYVASGNLAYHIGEVRAATDPVVVAAANLWVALTDAELASGLRKHSAV